MPSNKEIFEILNDIKKYEPVKTDSWTGYNIKVLWFTQRENLITNTDLGYKLTKQGHNFLNSNLDYDVWILPTLKDKVEKSQRNRFIILYELYKIAKRNLSSSFSLLDISTDKKITKDIYEEAKFYLENEGLIKITDSDGDMAKITHQGIKIIEFSIMFPELKAADLFPSLKSVVE